MPNKWVVIAAVAAGIILLPAIVAGAGFLIAIPVAIILLIAAFGGPKLWELYLQQNVGAKGRTYDIRDVLGGGSDSSKRPADLNDNEK